ncbi:hypothetical protein GH714_037076 [Hevea brasiliensis]|uniref:Uncharacterized protein n=1 Tax=Hevea brasiliensis TaxID=3981 RepID=A0A6A6M3E1_HEVBR|nr:hypothetical protein GH714_037076 [Hevea brasiliensis]
MAITSNPLFFAATIVLIISAIIAINRTKFSDKPSYIQSFSGDNIDKLNQQRELLHLGSSATGPESFAFGKHGQGPYASIADGRIIKWEEHRRQWIDFAVTSLHRAGCERSYDHYQVEPICGRPLGLCVEESSGDLYIADAYMGLLMVGPEGGLATTIATLADGIPFRFTNGLDIDQSSGTVYFTDSSSVYQRRILRYWIKTCKIGTLEVFAQLPGFPDNIKRSPRGGYWVGLHSKREKLLEWILSHAWIGNALIRLPFDLMKAYSILGRPHATAIKLSENGKVLEVLEDCDEKTLRFISEVEEKDGKLWIGSVLMPFLGVYDL